MVFFIKITFFSHAHNRTPNWDLALSSTFKHILFCFIKTDRPGRFNKFFEGNAFLRIGQASDWVILIALSCFPWHYHHLAHLFWNLPRIDVVENTWPSTTGTHSSYNWNKIKLKWLKCELLFRCKKISNGETTTGWCFILIHNSHVKSLVWHFYEARDTNLHIHTESHLICHSGKTKSYHTKQTLLHK